MLGKLIKYEIKSTWKVIGALLLFMLVMTALAGLSFRTPMWSHAVTGTREAGFLDIMGVLAILTYLFSLIGVMWGTFIYIAVHFYRNMYSDQGYLTHTLPVSVHQLLGSKILVNGIWLFLVTLGMILSLIGLVAAIMGAVIPAGENAWVILWEGRVDIFKSMDEAFRRSGINTPQYYVSLAFILLFGPFASAASIFGALTMGQLFTKHRVIIGILSYFAIGLLENILVVIVQIPFMVNNTVTFINHPGGVAMNMNLAPNMYISVGVSLLTAIALYFASHAIITGKLNLE